jgi:dipeptidyl aminopeptidase/acylaminoacyl peptidase
VRRTLRALALTAALLSVAAGSARAAFPGQPGRLAYTDVYGINLINADGTAHVVLSELMARESEPAWSPDGRLLAYRTAIGPDGESDTHHPWVGVMNADGSGRHLVVQGDEPAWSPDGRWLAFSRIDYALKTRDVWIVRNDGSDARRLTTSVASERSPAWSPDGTRIAFVTNRDSTAASPNVEIYSMKTDGSDQRNLTRSAGADDHPNWSPDGRLIVFDRDVYAGDVWVMNTDGTAQTRLTQNRQSRDPAWSPDGTTIVYSSDPNASNEAPGYRLTLMTHEGLPVAVVRDALMPGDFDADWSVVPATERSSPPPGAPEPPVVEPLQPAKLAGVPVISTATVTLSRSGTVALRLRCPAGTNGCRGILTLRTVKRVACAPQSARRLTLGSRAYTLRDGARGSVPVRVSRTARTRLRCLRTVRVEARAKPSNGAKLRRVQLTLRLAASR